jgi:hypothetical protein
MKETRPKPYDHIIHPYIFLLKEGNEIQDDFLDYSLLMLQVSHTETILSPNKLKSSSPSIQLLKR